MVGHSVAIVSRVTPKRRRGGGSLLLLGVTLLTIATEWMVGGARSSTLSKKSS